MDEEKRGLVEETRVLLYGGPISYWHKVDFRSVGHYRHRPYSGLDLLERVADCVF